MGSTANVVAAILAGGRGTRFRPYTEIIPKPMIPVGPEEKPILEHILAWLRVHDIRRFVFLVGYKWRQIRNYFRDGRDWDAEIKYSIDSEEYNNTGGALVAAYLRGFFHGADSVLVWYGDILAPVRVDELLQLHQEWSADATLVLADRYQVPVGVAEVTRDNNVKNLVEKPWLNLRVTIGILALRPETIAKALRGLGKSFDIMGDMIPWMIKQGMSVKAYIYKGPWYDVGSMERYAKLNHDELGEFLQAAQKLEKQLD